MAKTKSEDVLYYVDGSLDWSGGVDSSKVPTVQSELNANGLRRNQLAWAFNATVRGGPVSPRTGWQVISTIMPSGHWQGGFLYEPDGALPYMVCSVSGILYSVTLGSVPVVTDLTGGNPALQNPDTEMVWFVQGESYLVIQSGDYGQGGAVNPPKTDAQGNTLPLFWDGGTLRRSIGIISAANIPPHGPYNELPAAQCMIYHANRIWYAQNRLVSAGDIVGGTAGNAGVHYRDSILYVTENPLCIGGDGFSVPTNAGNIRALGYAANPNNQLGQGPLLVGTRKQVFALVVPFTRKDWIAADTNNRPEIYPVQINSGPVGHRCFTTVNGDVYYQAFTPAVFSLISAVRNFQQPGNMPISNNEKRAMDLNNRGLMRFSSSCEFDNRLLELVLPRMSDDGVNVVHDAILPLDFDIVTSFDQRLSPVWEGAHSGLPFLEIFSGDFGGLPRCFGAVLSDIDNSLQLWELTNWSRTENGDGRIQWGAEWPAMTWASSGFELDWKQLVGGELWVDQVSGKAEIDVYYRVDADPCWHFWTHTDPCAARNCAESEPPCYPTYPAQEFRTGYEFPITLPAPPTPVCDSMHVRPTTIGYQFQVRVLVKGWCRVKGLMLHALPRQKAQYNNVACPPAMLPKGMGKLPQWNFQSAPPTPPVVTTGGLQGAFGDLIQGTGGDQIFGAGGD